MAVGIGQALDDAWSRVEMMMDVQATPNPEVFQVILLVVLGFVGGRIVSEVVLRFLRMTSLDEIGVKSDIQLVLRKFSYRGTVSNFVADLIKWAIYSLTLLAILNLFGSDLVTESSEWAMLWASKLVVATFIGIVGVLISEQIGSIVVQMFRVGRISGRVDESHAEIPLYIVVGKMVKYIGYIITVIIALGFLGVDTTVIHILIAVFSAGIMLAFVLASRHIITNSAISLYFQTSRMFRGGEYVTIGDRTGEILSIRPLYTKIRSNGSTYYIPNTELVSSVIEYDGEGE